MDNMYPPYDGDFRERPTEQMAAIGGQPGRAEPDNLGRPAGPAGARSARRRLRAGIAVAAAAVLLCGGAVAGAAVAGGTSSASPGPTEQAAVLNTMLSSAASPASSASAFAAAAPAASPAAARCRTAVRHLRAAGRPRAGRAVRLACRRHLLRVLAGIHGQFTFETKTGPRTLAFERGVVESVSPTAIVVRAQDGTTWTWDLVSNTVVRQHGQRVAKSTLSAGQHVFVGGPVTGGVNDARLIVIRAADGSSATS